MQRISDDSGQALLIAALCMVVVISFLGLAVDVGHLRYAKRNLQMAADAAALAAGLEIRICGTTPNCDAMRAAAVNALAENGLTGSTVIANCASSAGSSLTLMVNNSPCSLGANDPNSGNANYVEVILSEQVRTYFARIAGFDHVPIRARAEAKRAPGGPCIYALDRTNPGAITVSLLASLVSTCGVVDESSSPGAFSCLASVSVTAKRIDIAGGTSQLLCSILPRPNTNAGVPTPADPLAYLPAPAVPPCGTTTKSPYHGSKNPVNVLLGSAVFYPGSYCGGITVGLLATATFMPGTYVLSSTNTGLLGAPQGGLNIYLGSTVSGDGVTFYNYGPKGGIVFTQLSPLGLLGGANLTAPTSGTYAGILFFQDPVNTDPALLLLTSSNTSKLEGAYYFPTASVSVSLSGPASYNYLVAKDINFTILTAGLAQTTLFRNDYSSLPSSSPLGGDDAVLVQ